MDKALEAEPTGPVTPLIRDIFVSEIRLQCQAILIGADGAATALEPRRPGWNDELWYHLQGVVVAAANISKMLWGSSGKKDTERLPLREYLMVEEASPLRDPDLRNDFEHFDERLEEWGDTDSPVYFGRNVGAGLESALVIGGPPIKGFHHYDPATTKVSFWEHEAIVADLVVAAQSILETMKVREDEEETAQRAAMWERIRAATGDVTPEGPNGN